MKPVLYMLDTNICSYVMREHSERVVERFRDEVARGNLLVVSAITYAELRFGASAPDASPRYVRRLDGFVARLNGVLAWDATAVDETSRIREELRRSGTTIGPNDASIAGHALSAGAVVVTSNTPRVQPDPRFGAGGLVYRVAGARPMRPLLFRHSREDGVPHADHLRPVGCNSRRRGRRQRSRPGSRPAHWLRAGWRARAGGSTSRSLPSTPTRAHMLPSERRASKPPDRSLCQESCPVRRLPAHRGHERGSRARNCPPCCPGGTPGDTRVCP